MYATARVEFGLSDEEIGFLTLREYEGLWKALRTRELRQLAVPVRQMGHLIAMVANTGMVKWEEWRTAEDFIPAAWHTHAAPVEDLDTQLRRTMERLKGYQDGQV